MNQDSDWNGCDGDPLNKPWDTHTDDLTGAIAAADTSYICALYNGPGLVRLACPTLGTLRERAPTVTGVSMVVMPITNHKPGRMETSRTTIGEFCPEPQANEEEI